MTCGVHHDLAPRPPGSGAARLRQAAAGGARRGASRPRSPSRRRRSVSRTRIGVDLEEEVGATAGSACWTARNWLKSRSAIAELGEGEAVVDAARRPGSGSRARRPGTRPAGVACSTLAARRLVHAPVEGREQRVQRVLAACARPGCLRLQLAQVLGHVAGVGQPEQVEQALAAVGGAHRPQRRGSSAASYSAWSRRRGLGRPRGAGGGADLAAAAPCRKRWSSVRRRGWKRTQEDLAAARRARAAGSGGQRRAEQRLGLGQAPGRRSARRPGP